MHVCDTHVHKNKCTYYTWTRTQISADPQEEGVHLGLQGSVNSRFYAFFLPLQRDIWTLM